MGDNFFKVAPTVLTHITPLFRNALHAKTVVQGRVAHNVLASAAVPLGIAHKKRGPPSQIYQDPCLESSWVDQRATGRLVAHIFAIVQPPPVSHQN